LFCPITSKVKVYPFEVVVTGKKVHGAILADQVKSLDFRARKATRVEAVSKAVLEETLAKIAPLLG
jgi:mRNA interferase MazF